MANDVTIDRLSIEISANAEPAAKSIGDLASAVKKFNSAIAGSKGFGDLVTLANASKTASDNMQDAPNRLRELASALNDISQSMKGLRIPSDLSKGFSELGASVRSIGTNVGQRLHSLAAGLSALRDVGEVRISSSVGNGINAINEALANLNVNNLSRVGRFVENVRQLETINNLTISGSLAREITNIAEAAELISDVDFAPLRDMGNAVAHLANVNDIRIGARLAENIVNLAAAVREVQGTDWTEFERMAAGLRHLEGLGQIRIPNIRPTQERVSRRQQGAASENSSTASADSVIGIERVMDAAESATLVLESLRGTMRSVNDVRAFVHANRDIDILAMRLAAARDRLRDLINVENGQLDLRAIANATEQVQQLERELANAQNGLGRLMGQFGSGFVGGTGLGGLVSQFQQIFSSPVHAIGFGLGSAIQFVVQQAMNLANALKNIGIKAFTASVNALKTALSAMGSAALAAGKGLVSMSKMAAKGLAGLAKIEFKGLMALPTLFATSLKDRIVGISKAISGFVRSLGRIAFYRAIRTAIKEVTKAFSEGIGNLYQWSLLVDHTFAKSMDKIATSMLYLKNSLGAMVAPILNSLAPAIDLVVDKIVDGINLINQFLAAITGSETYTAAKKVATEWAENETEKANKNLKELKKTILGFDELNILNKDNRSDEQKNGKKVADYASMFENRNVDKTISDFAKRIRTAFESGEWTQLGNLFANKLNSWIDAIDWTGLGQKLGNGLKNIVDVYNGFMDEVDWFGLGDNLANGINTFMDSVDWYELGRALTQHIDALFGVFAGFVEEFDWFKAGEALSDAVYGMFDGIDWDRVGAAIGGAITGIGDILFSFAENFPWESVGDQLASGANAMFDSVNWVSIAKGLNSVLNGALNSLLTFVNKFSWTQHGLALRDGLVQMVMEFPTSQIADSLTGVLWGILSAAMPTLKDTELMSLLGYKIADFFNGLFNPEKDFWGVAGEAANALIIDLLTIGDSFVKGFKEKEAAASIQKALEKIKWGEIATKTWGLITSALSKAGSFADALFAEPKLEYDSMLRMNRIVMDTSKPLGERIANAIKRALADVDWETIASDTWNFVKGGFKIAYDFVSAMFGLDEKDAADATKKVQEIGRKIGNELSKIKWNDIATDVWGKVQNAFSLAGSFVDALLGTETQLEYDSMLRMNRVVKDDRGLGEKIGSAIAKVVGDIKWGEGGIGGFIKQAATNLFGEFAGFFKGLTGDGSLANALQEFFGTFIKDGEFFGDIGESIKTILTSAGKTIGEAFGQAIVDGLKSLLLDKLPNALTGGMYGHVLDSFNGGGVSEYYDASKITGERAVSAADIQNPNTKIDLAGWFMGGGPTGGANAEDAPNLLEQAAARTQKTSGSALNKSLSQFVGDMLYGVSMTLDNYAKNVVPQKMAAIANAFSTGWNAGLSALQASTSQGIQNVVTLVLQPLNNLANVGVPNSVTSITSTFTTGWANINSATATAMTTLQSTVLTALTNLDNVGIPNKVTSFTAKITSGWTAINANTATAMTQFQSTILTALTNLLNVGVPNNMSGIQTKITNTWSSINANTATSMTQMQSVVMQGISNLSNVGVPNAMSSMASTFSSGFYNIASGAATAMTQMQSAVMQAVSNIENVLPDRFRNMYNSIISMANGMIGGVENAANSVVRGLNRALQIHLTFQKPDWAGGGTYWWDYSPNLSTVSFNRVSKLAAGGILNAPTMLASNVLGGEAGREAVLPLETHTEWMDALAERVVSHAVQNGVNFSNGYDASDYDIAQSNDQELALLREQNQLLRQLVDKDNSIEISTGQIARAQQRANRRSGVTVVPVGG